MHLVWGNLLINTQIFASQAAFWTCGPRFKVEHRIEESVEIKENIIFIENCQMYYILIAAGGGGGGIGIKIEASANLCVVRKVPIYGFHSNVCSPPGEYISQEREIYSICICFPMTYRFALASIYNVSPHQLPT
jgi:hypothetical protein